MAARHGYAWLVPLAVLSTLTGAARAQDAPTPLVVFNAGSLGPPFRDLLSEFAKGKNVVPAQENSPSIEAVRKLTELGKVPDVLAVADYSLLPTIVLPRYASWYVLFGSNAMVLIYSDQSVGAREITTENWYQVLLRPGVRVGRSDFHVDPSGYRALMAMQLAEKLYKQPGLAEQLVAAAPEKYMRHSESDLGALVAAGELDYGWTYESLARAHKLKFVRLPPELDLSEPRLSDWYAQASVRIPGAPGQDSLTLKGEPIVFAATVPGNAPHRANGESFIKFLLGPEGKAILDRSGFEALPTPVFRGDAPASVKP